MPDAWLLVGAAAAGFVQGLSGFAFALLATVFWSPALPPQVSAPLIALCSVAGQVLSIRSVWPSLDLRRAAPIVLGGLAGVPVGVVLLPWLDPLWFRGGVGLLLVVYCPAMLMARRLPRVRGGAWGDVAAGWVGGVMGGIGGLAGPAPTLWCTLRGWDRDTQRAVFQTFLIVAQSASLAGYLITGVVTAEVGRLAAWVLPCVLLPSLAGTMLYAQISAEAFRRMVLVLLFLTGLVLAGQAVADILAR